MGEGSSTLTGKDRTEVPSEHAFDDSCMFKSHMGTDHRDCWLTTEQTKHLSNGRADVTLDSHACATQSLERSNTAQIGFSVALRFSPAFQMSIQTKRVWVHAHTNAQCTMHLHFDRQESAESNEDFSCL